MTAFEALLLTAFLSTTPTAPTSSISTPTSTSAIRGMTTSDYGPFIGPPAPTPLPATKVFQDARRIASTALSNPRSRCRAFYYGIFGVDPIDLFEKTRWRREAIPLPLGTAGFTVFSREFPGYRRCSTVINEHLLTRWTPEMVARIFFHEFVHVCECKTGIAMPSVVPSPLTDFGAYGEAVCSGGTQ